MTWGMMDCKYPANGSLQPGQGPGTPTGNVSTGLGHAGPGPAGGSLAPPPGELGRTSSHPCTPSLWGDVFSVIPTEQPHCRGSRERGVEEDSEIGGNHRGFLWVHSRPSQPITGCAKAGGFQDGAGGHFYGQSIMSHPCILQRNFE